MTFRPFLPLFALGLGACGANGLLPGLWYFSIGNYQMDAGEFECDENFEDASCVDNSSGGSDEWTVESNAEQSNNLIIVEILEGPNGDKLLLRDGMIYPGMLDGKTLTFTGERFERGDTTLEHESGDYKETSEVDGTITETFTLERESGNIWIGSWRNVSKVVSTWLQTDEWDPDDFDTPPFPSNPWDQYMELDDEDEDDTGLIGGGVENTEDEECSASNCRLEITQDQSASATIERAFLIQNVTLEEQGGFSDAETPAGLGTP